MSLSDREHAGERHSPSGRRDFGGLVRHRCVRVGVPPERVPPGRRK